MMAAPNEPKTVIRIVEEHQESDRSFRIRIQFGDVAEYYEQVTDPADQAEEELLAWYFEQYLMYPFRDQGLHRNAVRQITAYGESLFKQVFGGSANGAYQQLRSQAFDGCRLEISGSAALHRLHWEAMRDPGMETPVAIRIPTIRRVAGPEWKPAPPVGQPTLNILVVVARPMGSDDVGYRTVSRPLLDALRQADRPVTVDLVRPGTWEALRAHLQAATEQHGSGWYHAIHLDVHGSFTDFTALEQALQAERFTAATGSATPFEGNQGFLFFESPQEGKPTVVSAQALASLLTEHRVQIAVLNACQSAKQTVSEIGLAQQLAEAGTPVAVGMAYDVTVSAAARAMPIFYGRLAAGADPAAALIAVRRDLYEYRGREAYFGQQIDLEDWILPVMFCQHSLVVELREMTPSEQSDFYERWAEIGDEPATQYGFVGRDLDIQAIERQLLSTQDSNELIMHGIAGVGKSALLEHLAWWWQRTGLVEQVFRYSFYDHLWTIDEIVKRIQDELFNESELARAATMSDAAQMAQVAQRLRARRHLLIFDGIELNKAQPNSLGRSDGQDLKILFSRLRGGRSLVLAGSREAEGWLTSDSSGPGTYSLSGLDPLAASLLAERILRRHNAVHYLEDQAERAALQDLMTLLRGHPQSLLDVLPRLRTATPSVLLADLKASTPDTNSTRYSGLLAEDRPGSAQSSGTANGEPGEVSYEQLLRGGYDADDADDPAREDSLGFSGEINMLCSVLVNKMARPPLSVGLFGEWGSGKSFFMRLMRQRVQKLAAVAYQSEVKEQDTCYCSHVVQITFNAWHYMDANLWASLAAEIFNQLATPPPPGLATQTSLERERSRIEEERKQVLKRLDTYQQLVVEIAEARQRAEQERERVKAELNEATERRETIARKLAAVVAGDIAHELNEDEDLSKLRAKAAEMLGMPELTAPELEGLVGDLHKLSGQLGATWRLLAKRRGSWTFWLAVLFVIALLSGLAVLSVPGMQLPGATSIALALAAMSGFAAKIRPVLAAVSNGLDTAESALRRAETLEQQFREQQTKEQVELEAQLNGLIAQEQSLAAQLAEATAKEAEAKAEELELRAGRRLSRFLQERSGSGDYRSHLGLISLLHKDLQQLSTLLQLAEGDNNEKTEKGQLPRIDRIILYVDDLDRCPPGRVVEVLQAIHLLLALPLFVVVVGVDPRWLLRSLQCHYHDLLTEPKTNWTTDADLSHWASTPQSYLEKIFQIPFTILPMTNAGFARFVDDLSGRGARPSSEGGQAQGVGLVASNGRDAAASVTISPEPAPEAAGIEDADTDRTQPRPSVPAVEPERITEDIHGPAGSEVREAADVSLPERPGEAIRQGEDGEAESPLTGPQSVQEEHILAGESATADIFVEGSVLAGPVEDIDPNPAGLMLTEHEIRFIQGLAPMITTPRAGKRLLNIYRMIRSTQAMDGSSRFLSSRAGDGDYQAVLQLLAIVSGFPHLAAPTFEALLHADREMSWPAFIDSLPRAGARTLNWDTGQSESQAEEWELLRAGLIAVLNNVGGPEDLGPYREWAARAARFSFVAGRLPREAAVAFNA
jgi:hypothetical protein